MTRLVRTLFVLTALATAFQLSTAAAQNAPAGKPEAKAADASAPSAADKARARELYAQGQKLFREADFAGAERSFEDAYRAVPNPIVLLSVAECQVRLERYLDAVISLERYLEERPNAPDRAQVEAQVAKLREKPGYLFVESTPSGASIYVDGEDTGKLTPAEVELKSGDHRIELALEGHERAEQVVTVLIGSRQNVQLALPDIQPPAPVADTQPTTGVELSTPRSGSMLPVWIATGIAGAGLVTGAVLGGLALKEKSDFDETPSTATADKGERLALFADVGFGIAAAAGVTALVLYFTGKEEAQTAPQAFSLKPQLGTNRFGLTGKLRF